VESSGHRNKAFVCIKADTFFLDMHLVRARKKVMSVVGKKTLDLSSCPSAVPSSFLGPTSTNPLAPVDAEHCHVVLGNKNSSNRITGEMKGDSGKVWRGSFHGPSVAVSVYTTGCCSLLELAPK